MVHVAFSLHFLLFVVGAIIFACYFRFFSHALLIPVNVAKMVRRLFGQAIRMYFQSKFY